MRVIGGEARGLNLRAPRGLETRPTSDLMREVIFSILDSMEHDFGRVLDLYAGTGALGIEALSRGAESACFVERNPAACAVLRANLAHAGYTERAQVICATVARSLSRLRGPFDLVFCDPPYADHTIDQTLSRLTAPSLWGKDTVLIYEHSRRDPPPEKIGALSHVRSRSHGSTTASFYCLSEAKQEQGELQ
jgi:16S rRNA (guanine966-N2)-methyltransferase